MLSTAQVYTYDGTDVAWIVVMATTLMATYPICVTRLGPHPNKPSPPVLTHPRDELAEILTCVVHRETLSVS